MGKNGIFTGIYGNLTIVAWVQMDGKARQGKSLNYDYLDD